MIKEIDKNGNTYYYSTCEAPVLVDLSKCVIHFFPTGKANETGDLVFKSYEKRDYCSEQ